MNTQKKVKSSAARRTISKPLLIKIPAKNVADAEKYFTDAGLPARLGREALREALVGTSRKGAIDGLEYSLNLPTRKAARLVADKLIAHNRPRGVSLCFFENGKFKEEDFLPDGASEKGGITAHEPNKAKAAPLILNLSKEQRDRMELISKLMQATPEALAIGLIFGDLDAWDEWDGFVHCGQSHIETFADGKASENPEGKRIEDEAPDRLLRLAGVVFEEVAS